MSEFKFACPVCGQHITADSKTSGGQIECPTCFQKIVVPQAPASNHTKLLLSAVQVGKPRPSSTDAGSQLEPLRTASPHGSLLATIAFLVILCAAGAALFVFRDRIFKAVRAPAPAGTDALPQPAVPIALNTNYPIPTNITWTLDLTNAAFPETVAAGSVHGSGFLCERAILRGGLFSLSQGKSWPWDLAIALNLFARQGEELSGKTLQVDPDRTRVPSVVLRWKDAGQQPQARVRRSHERAHPGPDLHLPARSGQEFRGWHVRCRNQKTTASQNRPAQAPQTQRLTHRSIFLLRAGAQFPELLAGRGDLQAVRSW